MWIPTHYVCLLIAILLAESAALFIYTLVGLLKSNPMPWITQPPPPIDLPFCRMYDTRHLQAPDPSRHDISGDPAADLGSTSVTVFTSTKTVVQTSIFGAPLPSPVQPQSDSQSSQASVQTTAISNIAAEVKGLVGGGGATATAGATIQQTDTASIPSATSGASSVTSGGSDASKTDTASNTDSTATTSPTMSFVTSVHWSTAHVGGDDQSRSTSTSVVVVTPTATPK